jgi:zinc transporter 7
MIGGFSRRSAILAQLGTAGGAFAGTLLGLALDAAGLTGLVNLLLPFTAGGFIYVATVGVIPELLKDCSPSQTIKECLAIGLGIGLMALVAALE